MIEVDHELLKLVGQTEQELGRMFHRLPEICLFSHKKVLLCALRKGNKLCSSCEISSQAEDECSCGVATAVRVTFLTDWRPESRLTRRKMSFV